MSVLQRDRQMVRLLALGEQAARASEARFAQCVASAADAAATLSHIQGLILTAAPLPDSRSIPALAAGAHLRALMVPAAEAAAAKLQFAVAERRAAEAALFAARDRAMRLADQAGNARRSLIADLANREAQERPTRIRKAML